MIWQEIWTYKKKENLNLQYKIDFILNINTQIMGIVLQI